MRTLSSAICGAILWGCSSGFVAAAGPGPASATIVATATFAQRTSLRVSAHMLQFHVPPGSQEATATIDFTAAARVAPRAGIVLTVEPLRSIEGPGGAADLETAIVFSGAGGGTESGALTAGIPSLAARWTGGGQRHGRLVFTLRAAAPGDYVVPVKFLLRVE
jgi:hypothetical protein